MQNRVAIFVLSLALAAPIGLLAAQGQQSQQKKQVGTTGAVAAANVNDIVDNPTEYYGERVTVSGKVGSVFGAQLFNIEEEGVVDVDDELLVLLTKKYKQPVTEDSTVQVTGIVRQFVREDFERDYGITDWGEWGIDDADNDFFTTYDRKPVLIADGLDIRK